MIGPALLARRIVAVLAAGMLGAVLALAPSAAVPAIAKSPALTLVGTARYEVQPDKRRVRITVDLVATNRTRETVTTRYVIDRANLAVLPGTTGFRATNDGARVSVAVAARATRSTLLTIHFAKRLPSGRSTTLRLTFDLPDPGGSPARDVRVGDALVAFPVWAFGTAGTAGSSASVTFPAGYDVDVAAGKMGTPKAGPDGTTTVASGTLADPFAFSGYVVADRPGAFAETPLTVDLAGKPAPLVIRAWQDDPAWGRRVAGLLGKGLPALQEAIGVAYPQAGSIAVEETAGRAIGARAAVFDPMTGTIRIDYAADPGVLLHELAHLWFDGRIFTDRWIVEGFASLAADRALHELKLAGRVDTLTPKLEQAAVPLNDWALPGETDPVSTTEAYGRAASAELVRQIASLTGPDGLRAIVEAAARGEPAYGSGDPAADARPGERPADWRGLLDLLAERAGVDATELWRRWVARPTDLAVLDARRAAREAYAGLVSAAGEWQTPPDLRAVLGAWRFDEVRTRVDELRPVLAARDELAVAAAIPGLELPSNVRKAFESGDVATALAEARIERAIIDQIVEAAATGQAATGQAATGREATGFLARIGLLGKNPAAELAGARAALAEGDLARAQAGAIAAREAWAGAADLGGLRLRSLGALALVGLAGILFASTRIRRRTPGPPVG